MYKQEQIKPYEGTGDKGKLVEEEGVLVVNSSLGVNRCIRRIMTERFIAGGIATPESRMISLASVFTTTHPSMTMYSVAFCLFQMAAAWSAVLCLHKDPL